MYFKDVLGNTEIKNLLIKEVVANRSPHAQLFFGGDQSQQIPMALAFVTYLFCKNKFYYCFWGSCALLLVAGQIYVGTSYRFMAQTFFVEKRTVCFSLPN